MYKNRQKLYMFEWICIQIIHINADMCKNRPKNYTCLNGYVYKLYIPTLICIKIAKNYTCPVAKTGDNNASIQSKYSMERYS